MTIKNKSPIFVGTYAMSHALVFEAIDQHYSGKWEGSFTIDRQGKKRLVAESLNSSPDDIEITIEQCTSQDGDYMVATNSSSCSKVKYIESVAAALAIVTADATVTCTVHVRSHVDDSELSEKCKRFRTLSRCMLADALANHETKAMNLEMNGKAYEMVVWNMDRNLTCYEDSMELWSHEKHMYILTESELETIVNKGFVYPDIEHAYLAFVSGFMKNAK